MSRTALRLARLLAIAFLLVSCRDITPPERLPDADALGGPVTGLEQTINSLIQQVFPTGQRTAAAARWRNVTDKLAAGQTTTGRKMLAELVKWVQSKTNELIPPAGESREHVASRLILDMSVYAYRDPSQPVPAVPVMGTDVVVAVVEPGAPAIVVTPEHKAGVAIPQGGVSEPTVLVIYQDAVQTRAPCSGPLDTELCQYPRFYHFDVFPHRRLNQPARVGVCHVTSGPGAPPHDAAHDGRLRVAHDLPADPADYTPNATRTDGIEILPLTNISDFLLCGNTTIGSAAPSNGGGSFVDRRWRFLNGLISAATWLVGPKMAYAIDQGGGGFTLDFSNFDVVDPTPQHSRYCPTETDRTATYAVLDSAIAHAPESNTVVVCDGIWPTNEVLVNKAVTIRSEHTGGATLAQPAGVASLAVVLRINGVASGQVRLADLNIQFNRYGVRTAGEFDQVTVDSVHFTGPGSQVLPPAGFVGSTGLFLEGSSVATAHVTLIRSSLTQSYYGVRQHEPVAVDTYDSHFENIGWAGLILTSAPLNGFPSPSVTGQVMQKADVVGNVFINIPSLSTGAAVSIQAAGDHLIQNNQFTNTQSGPATASGSSAVFITRTNVAAANTRPARIRDNIVVSHGAVGDPALATSWGVGSAFRVISGVAGVSDSVIHNSTTGAYIGLDVNGPAEMTAFDNTFTGNYIGVRKNGTSAASLTRNDFTGYTFPMTANAPTLPGNPALTNGALACNWWGSAAAPTPLGPTVNPGGYLPFATQPIANTEIACNVSTDSPPIVRMCPTASGSLPTVPTLSQAIQLVAAGGTIKICDGTHTVSNFALNAKAVTIEGEGPGIPTLNGGGITSIFTLGTNVANTRVTVLRKLRFVNAAVSAVSVNNQYGTLLIEQAEFHPSHGVVPAGQTLANSTGINIGGAIGGGITIRNSTFDGGDVGIISGNSLNVAITANTFTNHLNAAIRGNNGGSLTVTGNTITGGCGPDWCIGIFGSPAPATSGNYKLIDNTITVDFARRTRNAMQLQVGTFEVVGNTITGTGGTGGMPGVTWPISTALAFNDQASVTVNRNTITGAGFGMWFGAISGTGVDNTISGVGVPLAFTPPTTVSISRSDFSDYWGSLDSPATNAGRARCNWWGSANGPTSPNGSAAIYTPWASAPIANTQVACDPNAPAPSVVRACASPGNGPEPTLTTIPAAIALVASGGTVKVCDGTHTVPQMSLGDKAITIEGEGPGVPTLDAGGANNVFNIETNAPTTKAIVLRKLRLRNARFEEVRVAQQYGSVLIDQVLFHPPEGIVGPGQTLSSGSGVNVDNAVGGGVTVQGSTFDGGDIGVNVNNAANVVVNGSTFANHRNAAIHARNGGSVTASGNTISNCGFAWCLSLGGPEGPPANHRAINNTITVDFSHRTSFALGVANGSFEVSGNVITGVGGTRLEGSETWPMNNGISTGDAVVTLNNNHVTGAWNGMVFNATSGTVVGNTVSAIQRVLDLSANASVSISRSDFSDYAVAILAPANTAARARCNWWGSANGPLNPQTGGTAIVYSPWAFSPIANTQVACNPNAAAPAVVRACVASGNGPEPTVSTIPAAIALVASGGTVKICDGTYVVSDVNLDAKSITIEGEGPGIPTIDGGGNNNIFHVGSPTGGTSIVLRKLRLQNASFNAIAAIQPGGSLVVDQVEFRPAHVAGNNGAGLRVSAGTATVQNSSFIGGDLGIEVNQSSIVTVNASAFTGQRNLAIGASNGVTLTASGNTVSGCEGRWCIQIYGSGQAGAGGTIRLLDNTVTVDFAHPLWQAMNLHQANFEIVGNVITGTGGSRLPNDPLTWPMQTAITINEPSTVILNGNQLSGANSAIGFGEGVTGTGRDNVISFVNQPSGNLDGVSITRSNITNYITPIGPSASGSLRCNWWGSASGPVNVPSNVSADVYTPWANAPIAGTSTPCDPSPPAVVRACGTAGGTAPTLATVSAAIQAVAQSGTVKVCDGTHVVQNVSLNYKAVTIENEGPGIPILDAQGAPQVFIMDDQVPRTNAVTLRRLKLINGSHTGVAVGHQYGSLLIDQVEFRPTHGEITNFTQNTAYNAGIIIFGATGSGLTVQNSTFIGGDIGVLHSNSANVVIRNNSFSGHLNAAIHGGNGGSITASDNTITDCSPSWCIYIGGAESGTGTYAFYRNTLTTDAAHTTTRAITAGDGNLLFEDNVITGVGGTRDPNNETTWPMHSGIQAFGPVQLRGNVISGVHNGVSLFGATGTATDNVIHDVSNVMNLDNSPTATTNMAVHRNDFYNFFKPVSTDFSVSSVTCNWWGSAAGPNMPGTINPALYTPWATVPIAKQPGVTCP